MFAPGYIPDVRPRYTPDDRPVKDSRLMIVTRNTPDVQTYIVDTPLIFSRQCTPFLLMDTPLMFAPGYTPDVRTWIVDTPLMSY